MGLLTPRNFTNKKVTDTFYPSSPGFAPLISKIGGAPIAYVGANKALQNINVFSVINRIASDVASAHFKTDNTAALERLEYPSNLISRFSFWQGILIQLCLGGNAYVPLVGDNLESIPLSDVQINYLPGNVGITYTVAENNDRPKMVLTQDQMLHFRLMPDPGYRFLIGRSPLESLQDALTVQTKSNESNLKTLENQMSPAGKLKISNLINDGEDLSDARDAFEQANTGDNSGRLMVLPDGFDYEQFEMKSDVFKALNENASYSADQISQAFGIPSDILGGGSSTESTHSNVEQVKAIYLTNLNTYVNPIVDELRVKQHAPDLELDIKDMLDVDDSILIGQIKDLADADVIDPVQAQFMLKRVGYLPDSIPDYNADLKGGVNNDN